MKAIVYPLPDYDAVFGEFPDITFELSLTPRIDEWLYHLAGTKNGETTVHTMASQLMRLQPEDVRMMANEVSRWIVWHSEHENSGLLVV